MASGTWSAIRHVVQRRRVFYPDQLEGGYLKRCLTTFDLTALGVGSTLGVGVYVLVGSVALRLAGPAVVLSFVIAAVASVFAGLCYAELGAQVPRAGSAYVYTYVAIGELLAFFVGWINIFEGVFGTASVARGLSMYVDSVAGKSMSQWFSSAMPIQVSNLSVYFDLFAFLIVLVFGVLIGLGVRESVLVNNVMTSVNVLVILFIVCAGAANAESANWRVPAGAVPGGAGAGGGGFAPFGALGVLRGAAVCFYGFVGFDTINAAGEESTSDSRPVSCLLSTFDACDLWCIPLSGASHSGVYLREVAVDFRGNRDRESPYSPPASWSRHPMPPKKRQQKPANPQEMPAPTPTRRRTARRRCQDLPTAEDSCEAIATPSSPPRRLDWSEEAHPKHSPTPFADTATLFADKANIKIPPFGKNVREVPTSKKSPTQSTATEDKIPSNRVINMDDPPASIPKICIKATPDWHPPTQAHQSGAGEANTS
ncbi:hypothetical protein ACJJTC_019583 [Scirpophaga incertulas]